MEEDPMMLLIKRHFEKVMKCVETSKNFDSLFGFNTMSEEDKSDKKDEKQKMFIPEDSRPSTSSMKSKKSYTESLHQRPRTPLLNLDDDDIKILQSSHLSSIKGSRKFLNLSEIDAKYSDMTTSADTLSILKDLSIEDDEEEKEIKVNDDFSDLSEPRRSVSSLSDFESNFEEELALYKKDVKAENAIKSMSTSQSKHSSAQTKTYWSEPCLNSFGEEINFDNLEYKGGDKNESTENFENIDEEENKASPAEMNFDTKNYVSINHMKIQKEMAKKIEDLYKSGDGK